MRLPRWLVLLSLAVGLALVAPIVASAAPCLSGQTGPSVGDIPYFSPSPDDEYCTLVDLTTCASPTLVAHWELFWPTACSIPAKARFRAANLVGSHYEPGAVVGADYAFSLVGIAGSNVDHRSPAMTSPGLGLFFVCIDMQSAGTCASGSPMPSPRLRLDASNDADQSYNLVSGAQVAGLASQSGNPVMYVTDPSGCVTGQPGPSLTQSPFFTPGASGPDDEYCTFVDPEGCLAPSYQVHWELYWQNPCSIPAEAFFRAAVPNGPGCYKPGVVLGPSVSYSLLGASAANVDHVSPPLPAPGVPGPWFICVRMVNSGTCTPGNPMSTPQLRMDASNETCQSYNLVGGAPGSSMSSLAGNPVMYLTHFEPPPNQPPDCSAAVASKTVLWPANHKYRPISILGVTDPDGDPVTIVVTSVKQDEPVNGKGDGNTCPDARIVSGHASVRAERSSHHGNGRVYTLYFTATDSKGASCDGSVEVCVPTFGHEDDEDDDHDDHHHGPPTASCINDGANYVSTENCRRHHNLDREDSDGSEELSLEVGEVNGNQAELSFSLPMDGHVEVSVFDISGRRVATIENSEMAGGVYDRVWRMDSVPKGLYFVRIRTPDATVTTRVLKLQ